MTETPETPAEWSERRYEENGQQLEACWESPDGQITVFIESITDEPGSIHYAVSVEQHIQADGYATTATTHERRVGSKDSAVGAAIEFMAEADQYREHCHRAELWKDEWVQFYSINQSDIPDGFDIDTVLDAIDGAPADESELTDRHAGMEDDPDSVEADAKLSISIYPRHISVVAQEDDSDE
jgi:hypothetical protein